MSLWKNKTKIESASSHTSLIYPDCTGDFLNDQAFQEQSEHRGEHLKRRKETEKSKVAPKIFLSSPQRNSLFFTYQDFSEYYGCQRH